MSITLFTDSGKAAAIQLKKEIEVSATKAALVTVELVFDAKAKAAVKISVNKVDILDVNPGETTTAGVNTVTFEVAAGHKYEVAEAAGLKEALVSVALEQNTIAPSDVEGLLADGRAAAVLASEEANETVRKTNAKILTAGKLNYQGTYSDAAVYVKGSIVSYEGSSYELLAAEAEEEPPEVGKSSATWLRRV